MIQKARTLFLVVAATASTTSRMSASRTGVAVALTTATPARPPSSVAGRNDGGGGGDGGEGTTLNVHWFRNDLRLHDNPALCKAVDASSSGGNGVRGGILPIFCFDPRIYGGGAKSEFGSLKCGPRRAKFVLDSVADLRRRMEERGSGLVVAWGKPEDVLGDVAQRGGVKHVKVFCQEEVASEELGVDRAVRSALQGRGGLETVWGSTLYHVNDLTVAFGDGGVMGMPDTFTPFRNKVEKKCSIGKAMDEPGRGKLALPKSDTVMELINGVMDKCSLSYLPTFEEMGYSEIDIGKATKYDPRGVMEFRGGETAALARVKDYIWDKDLLKVYFDTRNGMLGADYSTKFAPWLACGCLSPRYVAKECARYEEERIANKSTYWVVFELLWRDFFKFFALKHGTSIFQLDGTLGRAAHGHHPNSRRWGLDRRHLQAWKEGRTGYPLVDANMRELAATGFMSNRGRQNVCSFLAIDMNTDWRYGADHFETELLDYDVYSNWGNWCSGAGMTGGRLNRFNIVKQSKDYDCDGDYVKHWLPELKNVPSPLVHEPWKMTDNEQAEYDVRLGVDYPKPLIQPYVPSRDDKKGGSNRRKGGRNTDGRVGVARSRGGRGRQKEMKSLKQGAYRISD